MVTRHVRPVTAFGVVFASAPALGELRLSLERRARPFAGRLVDSLPRSKHSKKSGRGGRIRTADPLTPSQVR